MTTELRSTSAAVDLAGGLIRFDTSNPPGATRECLLFLQEHLAEAGVDAALIGRDREKPSLVARIPGRGAAPLLLHAHADVVPVRGQDWTHNPFTAEIDDGVMWGRGTVDMKGQLAMMVSALLDMRREGERPAGDVVLAVVSDEESGGPAGAHELVTDHAELFDGIRYGVGEDGGAYLDLGSGPRVHPIVVSEKRACWLRLTLRGHGGHGSRLTQDDTAVDVLARTLSGLRGGELERRITPAATLMVERLAEVAPPGIAGPLRAWLDEPGMRSALDELPPDIAAYLRSVTHHTAVVTAIDGRSATNVRPATIEIDVDGRLLPGPSGTSEMLALLRDRLARHDVHDYDVQVLVEGEPLPEPDLGPFYRHLVDTAGRVDPDAVAVPMITTASTDARLFATLGISCYGWFPAPDSGLERTMLHEPDEHLSVAALDAGAAAYREMLGGFPGTPR